jgi:hypothetical protein
MYLWNLGDDNFIGFRSPKSNNQKDNPNGAFGLGVWTIKVANCRPSLMILWAWGHSQNNGPFEACRPRAHYFKERSGPSALHGVKINGFPSIKIGFFFTPMIPVHHL